MNTANGRLDFSAWSNGTITLSLGQSLTRDRARESDVGGSPLDIIEHITFQEKPGENNHALELIFQAFLLEGGEINPPGSSTLERLMATAFQAGREYGNRRR